jgi:hypothetical protein
MTNGGGLLASMGWRVMADFNEATLRRTFTVPAIVTDHGSASIHSMLIMLAAAFV